MNSRSDWSFYKTIFLVRRPCFAADPAGARRRRLISGCSTRTLVGLINYRIDAGLSYCARIIISNMPEHLHHRFVQFQLFAVELITLARFHVVLQDATSDDIIWVSCENFTLL